MAVVRAKLAAMIARAESVQNWLENITYQMCNMVSLNFCFSCDCRFSRSSADACTVWPNQSYREQVQKLAGYVSHNVLWALRW